MGFVKFPLPPRHVARAVSNDPFVRLISNKSGRKLFLSPRVLQDSGIAKGDGLVIEHDEENVALCRVRRVEEGEQAYGILSQGKKDRYGTFTVAGTILTNAGYNPGQVAAGCGPDGVLFDATGFPEERPIADPPTPALKPWKLTTSPKVTIEVVRALVEQKPDERIVRDLMVKPAEIEAVKRLVSDKEIRAVRGRTKPGQEQWFKESEEEWTKRQFGS